MSARIQASPMTAVSLMQMIKNGTLEVLAPASLAP